MQEKLQKLKRLVKRGSNFYIKFSEKTGKNIWPVFSCMWYNYINYKHFMCHPCECEDPCFKFSDWIPASAGMT
jgi:hypothetical protein